MLKYAPFLLVVIALGCSQTGDNASETPAAGESTSTADAALTLPPATATLVRFTMPGMT